MNEWFGRFAAKTSAAMGHPFAFMLALLAVLIWAALGPACHFSLVWQIVLNTGSAIVTLLGFFLIQNTQNRDVLILQHNILALQSKIDELIRVSPGRDELMQLEARTEEEIKEITARGCPA